MRGLACAGAEKMDIVPVPLGFKELPDGANFHELRRKPFGVLDILVELERRRQIGLTIDPATAETTFWWPDINDPYWLLGEKHHDGCYGRTYFARNPGAGPDDWVHFNDLPEATCDALWERDRRRLAFPYGLHPDDDIINYPPAVGA